MGERLDALDRFQRRHRFVGFPLAVIYKFFDDQGNYLAAIVTYYAFIAIFPLLLIATSVLGFLLAGDPQLQDRLLNSALSKFPIIGDQLGRPEGVQGSRSAVIVGVAAALYGSLGLGQASQNAMNVAWSVPRNSRPNPFAMRFRSLVLLIAAGVAVLLVTVFTAVGSNVDEIGLDFVSGVRWLVAPSTIVLNAAAFTVLFRLATARRAGWRSMIPGAIAVAFMWQGLQYVGSVYVSSVVTSASSMNGTFALVLGLIGLIYIAAVMAILGAEINVVVAKRLFPRALLTPFTDDVDLTPADQRAYRDYAKAQRHKGFQTVRVRFAKRDDEDPPAG